MNRRVLALIWIPWIAAAETHTLTLRAAASTAMNQSAEVLLARLDQQKAAIRVVAAKDAFIPKVYAGSGAAYSYGFPMSVEGSSPSVVQAKAVSSIFNRQKSYEIAAAREDQRGAAFGASHAGLQAVLSAVEVFLDVERLNRLYAMAQRQVDSTKAVAELMSQRVAEGRELPLDLKKAQLEAEKAGQQLEALSDARDYAEASLAMILGFAAGDRVHPAIEDRTAPALPVSSEEAVTSAFADSAELARLQSSLVARGLDAKAGRAARLPSVDLVAQYGLLAKFNNYEDFFRSFQRHNAQLGVSLQIPLFLGNSAKASADAADTEAARLRVQLNSARSQIQTETERLFRTVATADKSRRVARLDLDVAREEVSIRLAMMEEGKAALQDVERARLAESTKWQSYYDAQHRLELAQYQLLGKTGGLVAALR
jgi:outer membrane protein TolC